MAQITDQGAYLPTTDVLDPYELEASSMSGPELKNFLTRLRNVINNISLMVNIKDSGYYTTDEFVCGQLYFPDAALTSINYPGATYRNVFRKVIDFGALPVFPAPGTKSIAHGIDFTSPSDYSFTRIYGSATNPGILVGDPCFGIPIPFASPTAANNIEVYVDATNVTITVGVDRSLYTRCTVVLEYMKS